jgi:hypothetical protein
MPGYDAKRNKNNSQLIFILTRLPFDILKAQRGLHNVDLLTTVPPFLLKTASNVSGAFPCDSLRKLFAFYLFPFILIFSCHLY